MDQLEYIVNISINNATFMNRKLKKCIDFILTDFVSSNPVCLTYSHSDTKFSVSKLPHWTPNAVYGTTNADAGICRDGDRYEKGDSETWQKKPLINR